MPYRNVDSPVVPAGVRRCGAALVGRILVAGLVAATCASDPVARAQSGVPGSALETIQVRPNVFAIVGAGANVVVHVGPDGAVLVNSGTAAMADAVLSAVKALTSQPIRYIINTSDDADAVGGNAVLAAAGVTLNRAAFNVGATAAAILAREETLLRMSAPTGQVSTFPADAWPSETFSGRQHAMYLNDDGIQVVHMPAAHTDGDSVVSFRRADVIVTGAIVDLRRFPVIDRARGGSIQGELAALNRLVEMAIPPMPLVWQEGRTLVVPGYGHVADQADLVEYRDMVTVVRDTIQSLIDKGMTRAQVQAANPTAGFRRRYGSDSGPWTTEMFVDAVYSDLTSGGKS